MYENISLAKKLDLLFDSIENTADYWDDEAAELYREKMRTVRTNIDNLLRIDTDDRNS